jgi:hypothetical protein
MACAADWQQSVFLLEKPLSELRQVGWLNAGGAFGHQK